MPDIATGLAAVKGRIATAALSAGRDPNHIMLLAVSKAQPAGAVRAALEAGQRAFGENYVQEALEKIEAVPGAEWHYIGRIQSNKTREIAAHFDWVHTVDRARIARRLSAQRPDFLPPLSVCIQVNVSGETARAGVAHADAAALAGLVAGLPRLRLRGLMTMPAPSDDPARQRAAFARLRRLHGELASLGHALDTLSMGMSADLEAAIAEGATLVRVGTAIFGARE